MRAVAAAPGPAGVRVWEVMSRGRGPRGGCPPPEGVDVAYPLNADYTRNSHPVADINGVIGSSRFARSKIRSDGTKEE